MHAAVGAAVCGRSTADTLAGAQSSPGSVQAKDVAAATAPLTEEQLKIVADAAAAAIKAGSVADPLLPQKDVAAGDAVMVSGELLGEEKSEWQHGKVTACKKDETFEVLFDGEQRPVGRVHLPASDRSCTMDLI